MLLSIGKLGDIGRAGSKEYPATYRIVSCPECYGTLYWEDKGQRVSVCDTCGSKTYIVPYRGPLGWIRTRIREKGLCVESIVNALYALVHLVDHYLGLRKLLLYLFVRGVSYL